MPTLRRREIEMAYQARISALTEACKDALALIVEELGAAHPAARRLAAALPPPGLEAMGT